jgi:hypothetical protein
MSTLRIDPPAADALSFRRLGVVLFGVALGLGGGVALACYCVALNRDYRPQGQEAAAAPPPPVPEAPRRVPEPIPDPTSPLSREERAEVKAALLRGVRYLKTTQSENGAWEGPFPVGYAALPGLTLLECGVPPSDPGVQKAAAFVRAHAATVNKTYILALAILFLDRLGDPRDRERIQTLALRLVAGQNATGGWTYDCPILTPPAHKQLFTLLKDAEARTQDRLGPLATAARLQPELRHLPVAQDLSALDPESFRSYQGDNSNTQFGILALWVARRHEVPLERTAALMVARYRNSQNGDGSWTYLPNSPTSPATTCAGLLGLAVGQGVALEKGGPTVLPQNDPAVQEALGFLAQSVGEPGMKERGETIPPANLYVLWSLERVAVLYGLKTIGDKDWYGWARETLLAHQQERGNWWEGGQYHGSTPVIDTCFALLTLVQANLAKDLTSKLELLGRGK